MSVSNSGNPASYPPQPQYPVSYTAYKSKRKQNGSVWQPPSTPAGSVLQQIKAQAKSVADNALNKADRAVKEDGILPSPKEILDDLKSTSLRDAIEAGNNDGARLTGERLRDVALDQVVASVREPARKIFSAMAQLVDESPWMRERRHREEVRLGKMKAKDSGSSSNDSSSSSTARLPGTGNRKGYVAEES